MQGAIDILERLVGFASVSARSSAVSRLARNNSFSGSPCIIRQSSGASILDRTSGMPIRTLEPGEVLVSQGTTGGDLFILEHGRLLIERDHVTITTISIPGALIGELSVLLLRPTTATVRAEVETRVRVIADARAAGARVLKEPQRAAWGGYHAYFADPSGFRWEVAHNSGLRMATDGTVLIGPVDD